MKCTSMLSQMHESIRQITAANRYSGHMKTVHRIQGFVAGALFITIGDVSWQVLASKDAEQRSVAWATAILAALLYAGIIASIDRNEKEPWQMLLGAFLWGTVISGSIAGVLNDIWASHSGGEFSIAPFTEEITKGAALFLIARYASDEFNGALDGIIYGAMVGIGFAMQENASYLFRGAPSTEIINQIQSRQFFQRIVLGGLTSHATYTAITGLGLGLGRSSTQKWLKILLPILGLTVAILAHGLWNWNQEKIETILENNLILPVRLLLTIKAGLLMGPFFFMIVVAIILSWCKEEQIITSQLANELKLGDPYVAPAMMFRVADRFRARWRTLWKGGLSDWWNLRQLQQAWIELAFCKWRGQEEYDFRQRIRIISARLDVNLRLR